MTKAIAPARMGRYVETAFAGERVRAFVPAPLPPEPPLDLLPLIRMLSDADQALGRLDGVSALLPDANLFLYMYVRKEAVLSSQIEGTQSTLDDLLRFEADAASGAPIDDVTEVSNYVAAMHHGMERLKTFPLSLRLICETHAKLLAGGRGAGKRPGEFRSSQNWIGGSRPGNAVFVPPPPNEVMPALGALETFLHDDSDKLPPLIKAGLAHVQFETIHPFLDGNGRVGRLLIALYLCQQGVLRQPLLYLSLYFKQRRADYYRLLQEVRIHGSWEAWMEYFLEGVASTANLAFVSANRIVELLQADRERIKQQAESPNSTLRVHETLQSMPYLTSKRAEEATKMTQPTINKAFAQLTRLGIVSEVTGKDWRRVFAYRRYLEILNDAAPGDRL
jgi:Fic family protein